jgi:hypothetical protein
MGSPMPKTSSKPRSPLRLLLKVVAAIVFVFILGAGVATFVAWRMASQSPAWWHPVDPADPQVDSTARAIENSVTEQMHRSRPAAAPAGNGAPASSTWTLKITDSQANAWLAARLESWLANRSESAFWPSSASNPQLAFEEGIIRIGIEVTEGPAGSKGKVVSMALAPSIGADGGLWLKLESLAIGRFGVPGSMVATAGASMLESRLPAEMRSNPDTRNFLDALSGTRALTNEPVMKLSDGRRVRMLRITARPGEMEVECQTLPR